MDLLAIGINHQTAPVSLREMIAFAPDQLFDALQSIQQVADLREIAILSTCNRTELYCATRQRDERPIVEWLCNYHDLPEHVLAPSMYKHWNEDAVLHLMRVASGLDSMVLGEPQILGQMKTAFSTAKSAETMGPQLNRLSQKTYSIAKKVRTQTAIGENPVSIAYAAVTLAEQIFSNLGDCSAMLLGAGETIELVTRHLTNAGLTDLIIANRTFERARTLAEEFNGTAVALSDIGMHLAKTDILIASTASPLPILGKGAVESALKQRRHRPIFMVDLAVPRDIEPEVGELADVYLYSVDDLQEIIATNLKSREDAAAEAESLIEQGVKEYTAYDKSLSCVDTLVELRSKYEKIKQQELEKAIQLVTRGVDIEKVLRQLANRLTNKIIHSPTIQLRKAGTEGKDALLEYARTLFELDDEDTPS
ncbi:MAG: glutamyl-tRNA reductase [Gammaproteobacteria bacterium]|nr:glutamyl-tRNA reductase [Gammaproteobacteria bacterium]